MAEVSSRDTEAAWEGISAAFGALGRIFICLDERGRVVHATSNVDGLLGPGSARLIETVPIEALLGEELWAPTGALRLALKAGQRKDRCQGQLRLAGGTPHPVSVSVAPAPPELSIACGQPVTSVVVLEALQAADKSNGTHVAAPDASRSHDETVRLEEALAAHRWRRRETARALRISRSTLWRKMREAGLG